MSSEPDSNSDTRLAPLKPGGAKSVAYAYVYLTALILTPIVALGVGVFVGLIDIDLMLSFNAELGFAVEWLVTGLVIVFLFWTAVQVIRVTGIRFVSRLISVGARIADNYQLPESVERPGDEEDE